MPDDDRPELGMLHTDWSEDEDYAWLAGQLTAFGLGWIVQEHSLARKDRTFSSLTRQLATEVKDITKMVAVSAEVVAEVEQQEVGLEGGGVLFAQEFPQVPLTASLAREWGKAALATLDAAIDMQINRPRHDPDNDIPSP